MPSTLQTSSALTRLNSVQSRMAKVNGDSVAALSDVKPGEILELIRRAHVDVDLKHEAAARAAGVKPSQYSAALNGHGNFGASWLWAQDDRFLARLLELVSDARQLTPERVSALRRRRIVELIDLLLVEVA